MLNFFGIITSAITNISPLPYPSTYGTPFPFNLKLVPDCVPSGILILNSLSKVGIFISSPNTAWLIVIGTSNIRSYSLLLNISLGFTLITTYKSPGVLPLTPASPSLLTLNCDPLSTPAGIFIFIFLCCFVLPVPLHCLHGSLTFFPSP